MNEPHPAPDLDQLLHQWHERRLARKDWPAFQDRVRIACEHPQHGDVTPSPSGETQALPASRYRRGPVVWFAAGVAAALLVTVAAWLASRSAGGSRPGRAEPIAPEFAWLHKSQLAEKAVLLREMERLFENRVQWIGETDSTICLHVDGTPTRQAGPSASRSAVAVRVVVVRRQAPAQAWTPVWAADVIAPQEQLVRLTPGEVNWPAGVELALWAYQVDHGLIAVEAELFLPRCALTASSTTVQRAGVPAAVYAAEHGPVEYQVFQTVAFLHGEV